MAAIRPRHAWIGLLVSLAAGLGAAILSGTARGEHWRPGDSSIHNSFLAIGGWFYCGRAVFHLQSGRYSFVSTTAAGPAR